MKNFLLFIFGLLMGLAMLRYQSSLVNLSPDNLDLKLKPGDRIESMVLTTGTSEVPPLWAFCSPAQQNNQIITVDCNVPLLSKLAIGEPFDTGDPSLQASEWWAPNWQLSLDGHPLELGAFGLYRYTVPGLAPNQPASQGVSRILKAWDVVLINPTLGKHVLRGTAVTNDKTFTWVVNFTVEPTVVAWQ